MRNKITKQLQHAYKTPVSKKEAIFTMNIRTKDNIRIKDSKKQQYQQKWRYNGENTQSGMAGEVLGCGFLIPQDALFKYK